MEYLYYPGCSLEYTSSAYNDSSQAVAKALDVKLRELENWNCCGSTAYMSVKEFMSFAITARNLAMAEMQGYKEMVAVCSGCFTTLNKVTRYMNQHPEMKKEINEALSAAGLKYDGTVIVRHLLDVLVNDIGIDAIKKNVKKPLAGLKVAAYSGCQISRPHGTFDNKEFPTKLDEILTAVGAEATYFPLKARCCGGMLMTTAEEVGLKMAKELLECASRYGAECIATACPLCQINLEAYQSRINSKFGTRFNMPIFFFTQLLGKAFDLPSDSLGLRKHLIPTEKVLAGVK